MSNKALYYAGRFKRQSKKYLFIFVNGVLGSENLQTCYFELKDCRDKVTELTHPFSKYVTISSPQPTETDFKENFRKFRKGPVDWKSEFDEFVADTSVTIPRYLIVYKKGANKAYRGSESSECDSVTSEYDSVSSECDSVSLEYDSVSLEYDYDADEEYEY